MPKGEGKPNVVGKFVEATFKVLEIVISAGLLLMIALTFFNVLIRYSNYIPGWNELAIGRALTKMTGVNAEIARISFIYLVYLGSIIAARDNKHLMIDTLMRKIPPTAQKVLYVILQTIIMLLMGFLARGAWKIAWTNINDFWVSTHFPVFMIHFVGVVLGVAFIVISLANLVRLFVYKEPVLKLFIGEGAENELEGGEVS